MPKLASPPTLDGKLEPGEWRGAAGISALVSACPAIGFVAGPLCAGALYQVDALRAYNRALAATAAEEQSATSEEINRAAAVIAKEAAGDSANVVGSIGPLGIRIEPFGPTARDEAEGYFKRQARGLLQLQAQGP